MTTADTLRATALQAFVESGYLGTSLQQIADRAGVSKASVLYHFDSKEALLGAAVAPSIDRLQAVVSRLRIDDPDALDSEVDDGFVPDFVDFLLEHRLEVHLFVTQHGALTDVPAIRRAHALIDDLSRFCEQRAQTPEDRMRVGIALAGSAYMLVAAADLGDGQLDADQVRAPLITVMGELLNATDRTSDTAGGSAPAPAVSATPATDLPDAENPEPR